MILVRVIAYRFAVGLMIGIPITPPGPGTARTRRTHRALLTGCESRGAT